MDTGLNGKVAAVSGASAGLGFASAQALAAEGVRLAICSRDEARIQQAGERIREATGAEVIALPLDVSRAEDARRLVGEAAARWGGVDILVTNAGGPPPGTFEDLGDDQWQRAFDLTLMSAVRMIREALPHMRRNRWGRIINLTSASVKAPLPRLLLSNSLRAAVVGMAKTLSFEVAGDNITVNNIGPGRLNTDRIRALDQDTAQNTGQTEEEVRRSWEGQIPIGRYGDPHELASLVVFLASEQAGYITGATVQVDGGFLRNLL